MKYLNENIEVIINDLNVPKDGMYRYDIEINQEIIFVGNTFLKSTDKSKTFYLNDILNSYKFNGDMVEGPNFNIIQEVEVVLEIIDDEYRGSVEVAFLHQYPNFNSRINTSLSFDDPYWTPMLQGSDYYNNGKLAFIPTYPYVCSDKLHYNYLGLYRNSNLPEFEKRIRAYCSETGHYTSDSYAISLGKPRDGIYGTDDHTISDVVCKKIGSNKQVYAITPINCRYSGSANFYTCLFSHPLHGWYCTSNKIKETINRIVVILEHSTDISLNKMFTSGLTNNFCTIDVLENSNSMYKKLRIEIYSSTNTIIGSITFDVTKLYNRNEIYRVPLSLGFEFDNSNKILTAYTRNTTIDFDEIIPDKIIVDTDGDVTTVAKLDSCSRYFLKWMDRYGMAQIQPFDSSTIFSEDFNYVEIENYKNERKKSSIKVQPKWKLNTKWLDKNIYPFYESIFVSPYLQLYDAKEDMLYDVILINTDYTEKTFKNQGNQMFNLQLDVELNKKQNIIY